MQPDQELSADHIELISTLSEKEIKNIDQVIYSHTSSSWKKMARVAGSAVLELKDNYKGVPDLYFAQRIRRMVNEGALEYQGNLESMRYSEVRRVD